MAQEYLEKLKIKTLPRLPLEGSIDLTYCCNNDCRHCWLKIPSDSSEKKAELTFTQIRKIVDEARNLCELADFPLSTETAEWEKQFRLNRMLILSGWLFGGLQTRRRAAIRRF